MILAMRTDHMVPSEETIWYQVRRPYGWHTLKVTHLHSITGYKRSNIANSHLEPIQYLNTSYNMYINFFKISG